MKFKIILALVILFSISIVAGSIYTRKLIDELPSISNLENYTPSIVTRIFDRNERLITELFVERRVLVPLKDIPVDLQNAFLATEDNDFYEHWGISTKGILRAFVKNLLKGKVAQGGSTITQQLSKTIFLTAERTLTRKIKEVLSNMSKIDCVLLDTIFFRHLGALGKEVKANFSQPNMAIKIGTLDPIEKIFNVKYL